MNSRQKKLLLVGALLLSMLAVWRVTELAPPQGTDERATRHRALPPVQVERVVRAAASPEARTSAAGAKLSHAAREEARKFLTDLYRTELLKRELDLEQQRYPEYYWQAERSGRELTKLQQAKADLVASLNAEANEVLRDLYPDAGDEPVELTAFFDADHAAPNLKFLSAENRALFEKTVLASGQSKNPVVTMGCLFGGDLAYLKWNMPQSVALRERLAAINPTQAEFDALLLLGSTPVSEAPWLIYDFGLARYLELRKWSEPGMDTAVRDLRRLSLPLEHAEWLAATRARAAGSIQEIWRSAAISDAEKRARVAQLERTFGLEIATRLALLGASLDEVGAIP
jgi:hypothetical protein